MTDKKLKPVKFKGDKASYIAPSWQQMGDLVFLLGRKIIESGNKYDRLITLAKGGWTWSRALADYLKLEEVGSIQIKLYTGIFETANTPVITQSLPVSVAGERLLVFDDVADSGETLLAVEKYLDMCGAKSIDTACLYYKKWCKVIPSYNAAETEAWIIFPHEIREAVELISQKWKKNKLGEKEIKQRFLKIGLPETQVDYFLDYK